MSQPDKAKWTGKIFSSYGGDLSEPSLPKQCRRLFAEQYAGWEALHRACDAMNSLRRRRIDINGGLESVEILDSERAVQKCPDARRAKTEERSVYGNTLTDEVCSATPQMGVFQQPHLPWHIQFNPGRIISAEAKIDAGSIAGRPCFLCPEHLPPEQQAVLYRETFAVLCNPFPIFVPHFTVAYLEHRPQSLEEGLCSFLYLAKDMSPDFSVFYNGPRCGASAPDHFHFQAYPMGAIPIEQEDFSKIGTPVCHIKTAALSEYRRDGRYFFLLAGPSADDLMQAMAMILSALRKISGDAEEAMVNVIASFASDIWRVVFFPRRKHRPDAFFLSGDDRRAVTPGAVEMGGLVVTTNERDFVKLDAGELIALFSEVSADGEMMDGVVDALRNHY